MRLFVVVGAVAGVLLLAPPPASAQTVQLPVGEAKGVRIVREHGAIVVVFTSRATRLWRRVAGKRVSVLCEELPDPDQFGIVTVGGGGTTFRAPRRGRRLRTGDLTRGMDFCEVWLEARTLTRDGRRRRYGRELLVSIPLTQRGAVHLDEEARARALLGVLGRASFEADRRNLDRWPTSAELVAFLPVLPRPIRLSVVGLASPADTPPAGSIGYYSDGARHVAAVVVSASGRRLFYELDVDQVIRSNVIEYIGQVTGGLQGLPVAVEPAHSNHPSVSKRPDLPVRAGHLHAGVMNAAAEPPEGDDVVTCVDHLFGVEAHVVPRIEHRADRRIEALGAPTGPRLDRVVRVHPLGVLRQQLRANPAGAEHLLEDPPKAVHVLPRHSPSSIPPAPVVPRRTRPGGFEPPTSASGGQRSIH